MVFSPFSVMIILHNSSSRSDADNGTLENGLIQPRSWSRWSRSVWSWLEVAELAERVFECFFHLLYSRQRRNSCHCTYNSPAVTRSEQSDKRNMYSLLRQVPGGEHTASRNYCDVHPEAGGSRLNSACLLIHIHARSRLFVLRSVCQPHY